MGNTQQMLKILEIFNLNGSVIDQLEMNDVRYQLDMQAYQTRIYILKLTLEDGIMQSVKVIKK